MKAGNIKGALLEFIVRELLKNCGFTNVAADGIYTYERNGLFFINGKGAAHDADVIMNPPIQMPFTYPSQLLFECKGYGPKAGLTIVRNALGLRNDVNDFEIVTHDSIMKRQNNSRANYAIEMRIRYNFQVGVAAINEFSKPAIEFAANNKIPLLSLSWFLDQTTIDRFNRITQDYIDQIDRGIQGDLYKFLKDRNGSLDNPEYRQLGDFLDEEGIIGRIISFSQMAIQRSFFGLLETGDMVFLFARSPRGSNILRFEERLDRPLNAEIHWFSDRPNVWGLTVISPEDQERRTDFDFFVPKRIFDHWLQFNLDKAAALDIKQRFFSKIFVFNKSNNLRLPFTLISLDRNWLNRARQRVRRNR